MAEKTREEMTKLEAIAAENYSPVSIMTEEEKLELIRAMSLADNVFVEYKGYQKKEDSEGKVQVHLRLDPVTAACLDIYSKHFGISKAECAAEALMFAFSTYIGFSNISNNVFDARMSQLIDKVELLNRTVSSYIMQANEESKARMRLMSGENILLDQEPVVQGGGF